MKKAKLRTYYQSIESSNDYNRTTYNVESDTLVCEHRAGGWTQFLRIDDYGNGLLIQGPGISLNLDYGQAGDLLLALSSLDYQNRRAGRSGVFTKYHKHDVLVRSRKS